jgi:nicotinate phosphoribosyltransferase
LNYLQRLRLTIEVDAVPEGTVVFPQTPLLRVRGSLLQGQLLETALLNLVGFPTLAATKAARIAEAAGGDPVVEYGLRRAQGADSGLAASRSAYLGGFHGTSNLLAGQHYGIPVYGTHAHSYVMSFPDERTAFERYAEQTPGDPVFLVDTYRALEGIEQAIAVGEKLREQGRSLAGIRLDSGDLAALSAEARRKLDEAGFTRAFIMASGDLDEYEIARLKSAGARIDRWGIGTRLATCYEQPSLGVVYKLGALLGENGQWVPRIKRSEDPAKSTRGGVLQVRRLRDPSGYWTGDRLYDAAQRNVDLPSGDDLLQTCFRSGKRVGPSPSLYQIRERAARQLAEWREAAQRNGWPQCSPLDFGETNS